MGRQVARRGLVGFLTLVAVSVVVFVSVRFIPGDPVQSQLVRAIASGGSLSEADVKQLRAKYQLDDPLPLQYAGWITRAAQGDLGRSAITGESVSSLVLRRLLATMLLGLVAAALAIAAGVVWGILAASAKGLTGRLLRVFPLFLLAIPPFSLGIGLAFVFAVWFRVLPASGMQSNIDGGSVGDVVQHTILPAITLAAAPAAITARLTYASINQLRGEDFVRTARSLGLPSKLITRRYVLPNALLPLITNSSLTIAYMLTAAAFVEEVFNWPGIGKMMVDSVLNRDYLVLQAGILIVACVYIVLSVISDVLYVVADPRIGSRQAAT